MVFDDGGGAASLIITLYVVYSKDLMLIICEGGGWFGNQWKQRKEREKAKPLDERVSLRP